MDAGDWERVSEKTEEYYDIEMQNIINNEANIVLEDMFSEGGIAREQMISWIQDGIYQNVYGTYSPRLYERRYDTGGGLADPDNIVINYSFENNCVNVEYENIASGNPEFSPTDRNLASIILSGGPYHYPEVGMGYFATPRDFYEVLNDEWGDGSFYMDYFDAAINERIRQNVDVDSIYKACFLRAYREVKGA